MPPISKRNPSEPSMLFPQKGNGLPMPRPVKYPALLVNGIAIPADSLRITVAQAKVLLGWETEGEYRTRITKGVFDPEKAAELEARATKGFGSNFFIKDLEGNKVQCWNNDTNRPFDETHSLKLAQEVLTKNWAGPSFIYEGTVNGETIIISRLGRVESGQHRLIALIFAYQLWKGKQKKLWEKAWPQEPFIESLIVYGISESEKVLRTLDNVKPRALSDVVFTSAIFADLDIGERKECSRMLDRATSLLWKRTQAGKRGTSIVYQTHSESIEFIMRHPKLKECIKHLFTENKDRGISNLRLSPGECAALLYLQGSCASDVEAYRSEEIPSEKPLDWEAWTKAKQFWVDLVKNGKEVLKPLRAALAALEDDETGATGRRSEKFALLAKGWALYLEGKPLTQINLRLKYGHDQAGNMRLIDPPSFGGIDVGETRQGAPDSSEEEVEAKKVQERERRALEQEAKLKK